MKTEEKIKAAFKLWRLIQEWRFHNSFFDEIHEKKQIRIEEEIGDIVEKNPELEDLIPYPICWR